MEAENNLAAGEGFRYLSTVLQWDGRTHFTLERPRKLLAALNNPQDNAPLIHVAGTNGKGSVAALTAAMLSCAGYRTGLFTSPHITSVTERCIIEGIPCAEDELNSALLEVRSAAERTRLSPSYFEVITAACFLVFRARKVDVVVAEVGLGGRLDATNAVERSAVGVLTSVALEHTEILGKTLAAIAREKCGVMRRGVPMICGALEQEAREEVLRQSAVVGAPVIFYGEDFRYDGDGALDLGSLLLPPEAISALPLHGAHQRVNCAVAARTAHEFGVTPRHIAAGISRVAWPGRLEWGTLKNLGRETAVLLDAAHNPDGFDALLAYLCGEFSERSPQVVLMSVLSRKDWHGMLERLRDYIASRSSRGISASVIFTRCAHPLAVDPVTLREAFNGGEAVAEPLPALQRAAALAGPEGTVVVCGSIFLLAALRPHVVQRPFATLTEQAAPPLR